ncbi:unnamed protein product [Meloidogyne enterolobii]|uniref:Uncharacterized protein n=1 Tax=Meloidogyne enterolobii TaxID=390850 RepID=A0ACB0XRQ1_MELEN
MSLEEYYMNVNENFEEYYKKIFKDLGVFMRRLNFSEFTLLNQPIKIDLEAIRNKTEVIFCYVLLNSDLISNL